MAAGAGRVRAWAVTAGSVRFIQLLGRGELDLTHIVKVRSLLCVP
jgi:hypothetical protein